MTVATKEKLIIQTKVSRIRTSLVMLTMEHHSPQIRHSRRKRSSQLTSRQQCL